MDKFGKVEQYVMVASDFAKMYDAVNKGAEIEGETTANLQQSEFHLVSGALGAAWYGRCDDCS